MQTFPKEITLLTKDIVYGKLLECSVGSDALKEARSTDSLRNVIADPLFKYVQLVRIEYEDSISITELAEILKSLTIVLSKLQTIRICMRGIDDGEILGSIKKLKEFLDTNEIILEVEISVNGIVDTNDLITDGSSKLGNISLMIDKVIQFAIPLYISYTLTPTNCYYADDLLLWLKDKKIQGILFHVSTEFERFSYLDNNNIRTQLFHLSGFIDRLSSQSSLELEKRLLYKKLANQLAFDPKKFSSVYWQESNSIIIDLNGRIEYSSVKTSPPIKYDSCQNTFSVSRLVFLKNNWRRVKSIVPFILGKRNLKKRFDLHFPPPAKRSAMKNQPQEWKNVLITGWYGTETTGDKAILGELIHFLHSYNPDVNISITTIDEKVSRQTNYEIDGLDDCRIVKINDASHPDLVRDMDAVIIGGGPLMEVRQVENIWNIFRQANNTRTARVIFGCGIGPIYTKRVKRYVDEICRLTTVGFFRDESSYLYAQNLGTESRFALACDPSLAYLYRWRKKAGLRVMGKDLIFAGLLREQTQEYERSCISSANENFIYHISETFRKIFYSNPTSNIKLLPMHMYWRGNDDRLFNRKVAKAFGSEPHLSVVREYLELDHLLGILYPSDVAIAMRYHGHLFCLSLGIPFLSIDYTGKSGKVNNLLKMIGYQQFVENFSSIRAESAIEKIETLITERQTISDFLLKKTDFFVDRLKAVYVDLFGDVG